MATKKIKEPTPLSFPDNLGISRWLVIGLDLSTSRSGYAFFSHDPETTKVIGIGSIKPADSSAPIWVRCLLTAWTLRDQLIEKVKPLMAPGVGIIVALEAATPRNDFLSSVHRVLSSVLYAPGSPLHGESLHILSVNASTLRSAMGLVQRGATNKTENISRAYCFVDPEKWPGLDTDSCDAVLMAVMGVYAACVVSGQVEKIPDRFLRTLCDATQEVKGEKKIRIQTKGILHRPEYWSEHHQQTYGLALRDARNPAKQRASKINVSV